MDRAGRIGAPRHTSLQGRAEQATRHATDRVRTRAGRLTEELLTDGWREIRTDAAYGVDEGSAPADAQDVDAHISHLGERLPRKRDRATHGSDGTISPPGTAREDL
jgi:hypothetical protein